MSQQIDIANDSSEFPVVLSLATATQTLFVQDSDQKNIAGATVLLNGDVAGTTDSHGQLDMQLTYNTPYNITVTQDGLPSPVCPAEDSTGEYHDSSYHHA